MEEIKALKAEGFDLIKKAEEHQLAIRALQIRLSEIAARVAELEAAVGNDEEQ